MSVWTFHPKNFGKGLWVFAYLPKISSKSLTEVQMGYSHPAGLFPWHRFWLCPNVSEATLKNTDKNVSHDSILSWLHNHNTILQHKNSADILRGVQQAHDKRIGVTVGVLEDCMWPQI